MVWQEGCLFHFNSSVFGISTIQCWVSSSKVDFEMPEALKCYRMDKTMGRVDNMDKEKRLEVHLLVVSC